MLFQKPVWCLKDKTGTCYTACHIHVEEKVLALEGGGMKSRNKSVKTRIKCTEECFIYVPNDRR